jgi:glycosyltransferase involved in cell wall biosynthesis
LSAAPARVLILSADDPAAGYGSASALRLLTGTPPRHLRWEATVVVPARPRRAIGADPRSGRARLAQLAAFAFRAVVIVFGRAGRDVDVVVSWQPLPTAIAGHLAARLRGIPHVIRTCGPELHIRWSPFPALTTVARPLTAWLLASADAVVVKSEVERRLLPPVVAPARVHFIPNAVAVTAASAVPTPRADTAPVRMLAVAQLEKHKGVDRIIHAFARACLSREDGPRLTIAGDGTRRGELERLAQHVSADISFAGRVSADDMPGVYRGHDVLVVGSELEGCSNACLEALAAGLPVIGPASALEGLIEDGENGFLAPRADIPGLTAAIDRFLGSRDGWESMRSAARATAAGHRPEALLDSYEQMLSGLLRASAR